MIRNYILIAVRNLRKSTGFALFTVSGLVLGMAAFAIIMQYVIFETSYDTFQKTSEDIYRVAFTIKGKDKEAVGYATTFLPVAAIMKSEFPEILDYNRILYLDRHAVVTYQDKVFQQENVIYADSSFFEFFDYPLLQGDSRTVLSGPNTAVISETLAKKYFGEKNPVGEFIKLNEEFNELNLLITGVHKDIPANTHIKPKLVVSLRSVETLPETVANNWRWPIYLNYVRLQKGTDLALFESRFPAFASQHIPQTKQQREYAFFLQPLSSVHLRSHLEYEIEANGSATMVYMLIVAAILTLVIAYVNYINLTTARSLSRAKEVGIRKVHGSGKGQLVRQFLMEAGMMNGMALLLATGIVVLVQDSFQQFTGISFDFSFINMPWFWMSMLGCLLIGTLLSGFYPSVVLAAFKPISALKGQATFQGTSRTRKLLVIVQFAATVALMINAYAVYTQMKFVRSQPLGADIDEILIINAPRIVEHVAEETAMSAEDQFKTLSLTVPGVQNVSVSASIPGEWIAKTAGIFRAGHEQDKDLTYHILGVDDDFLTTYSLRLLAGRGFSPTSDDEILLTEKSLKQLDIVNAEQAIGERIMVRGKEKTAVGVVSDYHHMSLHEQYQPIIFYAERQHKEYYSLKLEGANQNIDRILVTLEKEWKAVYPSNPFEYKFLDESFQRQYNSDIKFGKMFNLFAIVSIALACLGLFGLASYIALKRTKEIGVRKALGSTTAQVTLLLLREILLLLLFAGVLAVPIAYLGLTSWLNQFAFRIEITWWIFALPVLLVAAIALASISIQMVKAAMANPVKSLKCE